MKKYIILLLLVFVSIIGIGLNSKEVEAVTINFDFGNNSPRFQYLRDDNDELILFDFTIYETYDHPREAETFDISIEQITYNGNFIKTLKEFEVIPYIHSYDSDIRSGNTTYSAGYDNVSSEYLYIGDINTQYDFTEGSPLSQLNVGYLTVNAVGFDSTNYSFSEDNQYLILDAGISTYGDTIIVYYMYQNSNDYTAELLYDWSGILWFEDIIFYRIVYNELVLLNGAVMKEPKTILTYDTYGI